jgi:hypothetical protein
LELVELETEKSTLGGGDEHVTGLRVILGRWIWEQIQLGHLLTINLDEYKQLDGDGTRALYLYVSAIKSKTWEVDIYQLAETHLGMSHYEYPAHVWKKLKPILEAGKQQGVIAEYERIKRGKYTRVLLTKARRQLSLFDDASEEILVLDDVISARRAEEEAERTKMILDDLETHRAQYTPDEQCINIWRMVVSHIQSQSPATYQGFISHANLLSIDDGQVMVWVRSEYAADYLNSQGYGMLIGKLVARELGADYKSFTVQFVHPEGSATELLT